MNFPNSHQLSSPLRWKRLWVPQLPLICDPSHICGSRRYIAEVAQEAMDFLFDGLMIEVHCAPEAALSDSQQQLTPAQYSKLIKGLRFATPDGANNLSQLELLRREIDGIDNDIIALLAKRMDCVRDIGKWKRSHNISIFQPERWQQVVHERMTASKRMHLGEAFAREIFEHIHEEALKVQTKISARETEAQPMPCKTVRRLSA